MRALLKLSVAYGRYVRRKGGGREGGAKFGPQILHGASLSDDCAPDRSRIYSLVAFMNIIYLFTIGINHKEKSLIDWSIKFLLQKRPVQIQVKDLCKFFIIFSSSIYVLGLFEHVVLS